MPSELQEIETVTSAWAPAERLSCATRVAAARATIRSICSSLVLVRCPPPDQQLTPRSATLFREIAEYLPVMGETSAAVSRLRAMSPGSCRRFSIAHTLAGGKLERFGMQGN